MKLTLGDLQKTVTLEQVEKVLTKYIEKAGFKEHDVDLGELGYHSIDCDVETLNPDDVSDILEALL